MLPQNIKYILQDYLPEESVEIVTNWIQRYKIKFTIAGKRESILGDFTPKKDGYHISVNENLNPFAFLITTVHEIAHLTNFENYRHTVSSHGSEWKKAFNNLMDEFKGKKLFPRDVTVALRKYLQNPSATHCNDPLLMKTLSKYNRTPVFHLEDLKEGELFLWNRDEVFRKGKKLRKRFACFQVPSKRKYFFSPVAEVERFEIMK